MAQAFSLLVQEDKQRKIRPNNQFALESTSLNANTFKQNNYRTNYSLSNNYNGTNKSRPMCEYCKRSGHTKDKYYKLHGYPQSYGQNFKSNNSYSQHTSNQNFKPSSVVVSIEQTG